MLPFQDATPTSAGDWRHIVRFGRNVASYKFALGRALLDLAAQQQTFVRLEDLSVPYTASQAVRSRARYAGFVQGNESRQHRRTV